MHRGRGLNLIALPPCLIPLDTYICYLSTDFRTYPIPIVFVKPCPVKSIDLSTRCLIPRRYMSATYSARSTSRLPHASSSFGFGCWGRRRVMTHARCLFLCIFFIRQTEETRKTYTMWTSDFPGIFTFFLKYYTINFFTVMDIQVFQTNSWVCC